MRRHEDPHHLKATGEEPVFYNSIIVQIKSEITIISLCYKEQDPLQLLSTRDDLGLEKGLHAQLPLGRGIQADGY
jgi:hypothetical protein